MISCCGCFGFHTSFCLVVSEVDVEVVAVSFLFCWMIEEVRRSGVTTSFPQCVTTLVCCVLCVHALREINDWLTYQSSCLNLIDLVLQSSRALYFLCHGVPSIIGSFIPCGGMS